MYRTETSFENTKHGLILLVRIVHFRVIESMLSASPPTQDPAYPESVSDPQLEAHYCCQRYSRDEYHII
jgi:hypothetical protein